MIPLTPQEELENMRLRREQSLQRAKENKAKFELLLKLLEQHITPVIDKYFGTSITEGHDCLLLGLMEYAEEYHQAKLAEEEEKKNCSTCNTPYVDGTWKCTECSRIELNNWTPKPEGGLK